MLIVVQWWLVEVPGSDYFAVTADGGSSSGLLMVRGEVVIGGNCVEVVSRVVIKGHFTGNF